MTDPLLTIDGLTKSFGSGAPSLGPLTLSIAKGSFTAILGPSGCGKSTLLRIIAGLSPASTGAVRFMGSRPPDMGFVFQEATLMPWRRVADNVGLGLEMKGPVDQALVRQALDRVGLGSFAQHYPRQLSGGMRMRVSIARALAGQPDLLLMDEPFAALDEITRGDLNDDLLGVWQLAPFTAIFVTHSVFESVFLANRIVILSNRPGQIIDDITVDAPYPRGEDWRLSAEYAAIARHVSAALRAGHGIKAMPSGSVSP